jgi:Enolase C-terminal domain-like
MTADEPAVLGLETAVYVIPTDAPEADGTLTWDKTTMVLATARAAGEQGIGWSYTAAASNLQVFAHCAPNLHAHVAAAIPNLRHVEYFHDHQRIEQMLFDGVLDPGGGLLTPDPAVPGLGMELRAADAERYRRG